MILNWRLWQRHSLALFCRAKHQLQLRNIAGHLLAYYGRDSAQAGGGSYRWQVELPAVRTITICLLGYAVFFRFDEIPSLKESRYQHVRWYHTEVFVESSKQTSSEKVLGCQLLIRIQKPVQWLWQNEYFHLAECTEDNDKHLFRGLSRTKTGYRLRQGYPVLGTPVPSLGTPAFTAVLATLEYES